MVATGVAKTTSTSQKPSEAEEQSASTSSQQRSRSKSVGDPKLPCVKETPEEGLSSGGELGESGTIKGGTTTTRRESCPRYFGVKSYLHNFYDAVTTSDAHKYKDYEEYRYLIAPKRRRNTLLLWRIVFWSGLTLLVGGALILLLGYLVPRKDVIVGYQEEIAIIDESAVAFNKNFEWFKILGLGVFCVGGLVLSTALLLPSLVGTSCFDEDADEATPFKVRIGRGRDEEESDSDDDHKAGIPATETVKGVQPRREEEAVITKGALTQLK